MYTPHVVTVYNITESSRNITVLVGVFVDAVDSAMTTTSGLSNADSVTLHIPLDVAAYDARQYGIIQDGNGETILDSNSEELESIMYSTDAMTVRKQFVPAKEYKKLSDVFSCWTLANDESCFFVKGAVIETSKTFRQINEEHQAFRITRVDLKDFGSQNMRHWEVGGA